MKSETLLAIYHLSYNLKCNLLVKEICKSVSEVSHQQRSCGLPTLEVFTSKLVLKFGTISRRITGHSNSENQAHSEVGISKWKLEVSLRIQPSLLTPSCQLAARSVEVRLCSYASWKLEVGTWRKSEIGCWKPIYATCTSPIMHLCCPPKCCISIVINFFWDVL